MRAVNESRLKKSDSKPSEIIPGIYLGSIGSVYNKQYLKK